MKKMIVALCSCLMLVACGKTDAEKAADRGNNLLPQISAEEKAYQNAAITPEVIACEFASPNKKTKPDAIDAIIEGCSKAQRLAKSLALKYGELYGVINTDGVKHKINPKVVNDNQKFYSEKSQMFTERLNIWKAAKTEKTI